VAARRPRAATSPIVLIFGMSSLVVCAEMTCDTKSSTCIERASSTVPSSGRGMKNGSPR
jgi:hypothetical protein